jgi:glycosyltransferase involved in cell wall biosynthesis
VQAGFIEYAGRLQDVRPEIAAAQVYVLPSYREGTPRTVLEAMAMGRAIVTTDTPGCRETVKNEWNGLLVEPRDAEGLAAAMERFIVDPALAATMGQRSRELAVEKYDANKVANDLLTGFGL